MSYEALEKNYETLTPEQQLIVYNLVISLGKLNAKQNEKLDSGKKENLSEFFGALKIDGDPLTIQKEMRDEWN
ncbi:MAG: hypothetical protein J6T84_07760 [Spirochaetaceae bacterium]|nr:hypothetical protein [Spirochaetaceae bacterium]